MKPAHVPVLGQEAMRFLRPEPRKRYLDGTLGGGGHTEKLLIESSPDGQVLGLDWDDEAIEAAQARLRRFGERLIIRRASFASANQVLEEIGWHAVDGVILDLGVSSYQLESPERGFSFRGQSRLDMRMDRRQSLDARQIVNSFSAEQLERILRDYGEEPQARRIAQAIVAGRKQHPLETTAQLVEIIERFKGRGRRDHHPARRGPRSADFWAHSGAPGILEQPQRGGARQGARGERIRDRVPEAPSSGASVSGACGGRPHPDHG